MYDWFSSRVRREMEYFIKADSSGPYVLFAIESPTTALRVAPGKDWTPLSSGNQTAAIFDFMANSEGTKVSPVQAKEIADEWGVTLP
jgi:hypothetical protein